MNDDHRCCKSRRSITTKTPAMAVAATTFSTMHSFILHTVSVVGMMIILPPFFFEDYVSAFHHHQHHHQRILHINDGLLSSTPLATLVSNRRRSSGNKYRYSSSGTTWTSTSATMIQQQQHADSEFDRPSTFLDRDFENEDNDTEFDDADINIVWLDEVQNDDDDADGPTLVADTTKQPPSKNNKKNRWERLNPKIKEKLIERGQVKAIANKAKRVPAQDKKRRMMMEFKRLQQESKKASMVKRPLPFDQRAPLTTYFPGTELTGVVISLTPYGAYVDVGTECDGLLHVSQFTRDFFVEHPRQMVSPGDQVTVKVRMSDPSSKKLHLTMLDDETLAEEMAANNKPSSYGDDDEDRIPLTDIEIDDELWGELKRVTDFGAYIEVGAEVDGFLHFMDHPEWTDGMHPSEFMKKGQRVRVWVADLDNSNRRIRLTANRPRDLNGPRFEKF